MAEGTEPKSIDGQISRGQLEINECLGNWLTYLQTLNGLCTAGTKLAQSLQALLSVHDTVAQCRLTGQCLAGWEELARATHIASSTVKNHVITALRDHESRDNDGDKHDILRENLLTFVNLQYQFCVACCECLGGMAECSCSQSGSGDCDIAALQQCFERLYSSPVPPISSSSTQQSTQNCRRSPLPYSLFPLQVQRRWSETAAAEMSGESVESTMRRWSMPWDCKHVIEWPRQDARSRLRVPQQDRSRSTTPDSVWKTMASQDGLQEAIQLLSCKPGVRSSNQLSAYTSQHIPGVTLTTCNFDSNYDSAIWSGSRRIGSPRCWPQDSSDHSDQSGHRDSDHSVHSEHRDSEQSGASGSHGDSKDSIHSHCDHREIEAGIADTLPSRKSSSSTDSCVSVHSRSGSESAGGGECTRSQLYSMWSGGDLSFIKLPESNEVQDEHPPT
ncbi:PREDICTED: uncharacterized protein LOC105621377 [Atta cephalotes]|uniref:DUF4745 domain-containing protein n=1 Tax=Atta cephalotes TaxID=12957 RepID=A0A158NL27_ATTCE|nr:PREDICTED: uncharacterized protein LOC105621377 [Atta cephalotes]XP_018047538.1 PREDICTED: uncharacterized protein LOC108686630 isoform X1 [Atta colombica]XP_018047539.1 PREDICTED: uncharacterized protein LOC108686630 isoform X1 [Atta colombica]